MKLKEAEAIARHVVDLLTPACVRIEIAGSIRRRKPEVKDVEIVAIAHTTDELALFGVSSTHSELEDMISSLVGAGKLAFDQTVKRNGPKAKKLVCDGISIDLFIAEAANWGNTLAIRTGDTDFSRLLVTPRRLGGLMPGNMRQADGYLWRGDELIECATEERFFDALMVSWVEPQFRNEATARKLAREVVHR